MKTTRQLSITIGFCLTTYLAFCQLPPSGNPPATNTNARAAAAWYRGGNTSSGNNDNIFGTLWNSPIFTRTANANRMRLNGNTTYAVNGYSQARNGYLLLGYGTTYANGLFANANFGAFSLFHLNGQDGSFVQEGGYRPWMKTGITMTDNDDLSYFGLRKVGTGTDLTETTISWTDNWGNAMPGPDDLVFRFLSGGTGNTNTDTDLMSVGDLDGLHVARFTPEGAFGLGNTFGINTGVVNFYVRPQSLFHLSLSNRRSVWQQFTNRDQTIGSGTGETPIDGLRLGILGSIYPEINGTGLMYNQENRHLLFSTNANTNTVNPNGGVTHERMRITNVGTHTNLPFTGYGVFNPANLNTNFTRVSISHNPSSPVTRPMSLMHLGYNTSDAVGLTGFYDGWRPWMDVGMFISNGTDNTYMGLKQEGND